MEVIKKLGRKIVIFYPEHFSKEMLQKNYNNIINVLEINLPEQLYQKYTHRDYLSALIKLGINREKIGDIIVSQQGANIILLKEIIEYTNQNILNLMRFSKSKINIKQIENLNIIQTQKEEIKIIVPSLRIDNIVAQIAKTSRNKANELIAQERVLVNYETITKNSKIVKEKDIITIRGKGKFQIIEQIGQTKKDNKILKIEKYK